MAQTVFITGTNSGIGKATVELFAEKGWNVAATVRDTEKYPQLFDQYEKVKLYSHEITDFDRVSDVASEVIRDFRTVDVIVNNAAYCLIGPLETTSIDQLKNQYETNVFGVYATIKAFLPYLRRNKAGTIINLSSSSAQFNFPFISGYGSTKWAVRGITESLGIELAPFHIHVKAIYPGLHATDIFTKLDHGGDPEHPSYQAHKPFFRNFMSAQTIYDKGTVPDRAAREIWRAVDNRAKGKLHFITDGDAKFLAFTRKILSERRFQNMQIGTIQKPAQQNQKGFITWLFGKHVKEVKTDIPDALIR